MLSTDESLMEQSEMVGGRYSALPFAALLMVAAGCAPNLEAKKKPAFHTDPAAPQPRLQVDWRQNVDEPAVSAYRPRQFAGPTVARTANGREVLVGTDEGWVYRLRAGDGDVRWEVELDGPVHGSPVAEGDRVYVGTTHGTFYALDRTSGSVDWTIENDREIESRAAAGGGLVFYTTNAGRLVAADASSGETAWTYSRSIPEEFTIQGSGTPVVEKQTVYCGFSDGSVAALEIRSGAKKWVADVSSGKTDFTDVGEPVIVRGDHVYATSYGAGLSALDRESGSVEWTRSFENIASTAYVEETVYAAVASGRVVALDADDGTSKWGFSMSKRLPVELVPSSAYLFVSTANGPLYTLDRATGYPLLKWTPSTGINTAVAFSDRAGFMLSNKGFVYRFQVAY
jgi:outer membrane protein assembly factor BamB